MKPLFKNKKDIISYVVVAVISLAFCIYLLIKSIDYFQKYNFWIQDWRNWQASGGSGSTSHISAMGYLESAIICLLCIVLIIAFNTYHLLKLRAERLSPELKAKIASEAAEKKRLKLEKKAQSLQNELDKLDDGDKQ